MPRRFIHFAAIAIMASAALCAAQNLQRVEEVWGDAGPLNQSLRQMPVDMRQPTGFEFIYRVPGADGLLTRIDGGMAAVFPRSVYSSTRGGGVIPLIPPGTVFHVGGLRDFVPPPASPWASRPGPGEFVPHSMAQPIVRKLVARTPGSAGSPLMTVPASSEPTVSIWDDEFYRRDQINTLLGVGIRRWPTPK